MKHEVIEIGFVGGGLNSAVGATHFVASQMDTRFRVVAGCFSTHQDINSATAEYWHIDPQRCYSNWLEFLDQEKGHLGAVVILTPTPDHLEHVSAALDRGYAVICEKSLVGSSDDAAALRRQVESSGGFLTVTYNYTGYPMLREMRKMAIEGKFGRLEQIHVEMPQESYLRLDGSGDPLVPQEWRLHDGDIPTLSLDLGVHVHHLIDFITGRIPIELVAVESSLGSFRQVVDNSLCIARYNNDLTANIWFSKAALGHRNGLRVRLFGDQGSAEWYQMEPESLVVHDNKGHMTTMDRASVDAEMASEIRYNRFKSGHPSGFLEAFANLYFDIADSLEKYHKGESCLSDFVFTSRHAFEGLAMLETMNRSAETGSWCAVDL